MPAAVVVVHWVVVVDNKAVTTTVVDEDAHGRRRFMDGFLARNAASWNVSVSLSVLLLSTMMNECGENLANIAKTNHQDEMRVLLSTVVVDLRLVT
jgi:hypothetical protein